jgi:hypothetical protein
MQDRRVLGEDEEDSANFVRSRKNNEPKANWEDEEDEEGHEMGLDHGQP